MSDRKEGWYWVKPNKSTDKWRPDYYKDGKWRAIWSIPEEDPIHFEIGSRIPTPDEMEGWQVVPKKMDRGMMSAAIPNDECSFPNYGPQEDEMQDRYGRALQAAPKPGDV